jgi:protocatechuate 3,4-dioxygenase beta subunit
LANFSVTTVASEGEGSLAAAILAANENPGGDTISFQLPTDAPYVIQVSSLPAISDPVIIDGTTQLGYVNRPVVVVEGVESVPGGGVPGFRMEADGSVIRGLILRGFRGSSSLNGSAIRVFGNNNRIEGNVIGSDTAGSPPVNAFGVVIESGTGNLIGGETETLRNVISANGVGIAIRSPGNRVVGNHVGTNFAGSEVVANDRGIELDANQNVIGGSAATQRNVISGNQTGIVIAGDANRIEGNFLGLDATGQLPLGNVTAVQVTQGEANVIGGVLAGQGNVISANQDGITIAAARSTVIQGNRMGTSADGQTARGNTGTGIGLVGTGAQATRIGGTEPAARNLIAGGTGFAILVNSNGNFIQGNVVGQSAGQAETFGNQSGGIFVGGSNNLVGGDETGAGNQVTGNGLGIRIAGANAANNQVLGNWIGTDSDGAALGNLGDGIEILAGSTQIGGSLPGQQNVIGNNGRHGIFIHQSASQNARVQGNWIGVDDADSARIPNLGNGIHVENVGLASGIRIGGDSADAGNRIWFNGGAGIAVIENGARTTGVDMQANSMVENGGLGIDLGPQGFPDGLTPNDDGDLDDGPNGLQNFPSLSLALLGETTRIAGTLDSQPGTYRIDFYVGPTADEQGEIEGQRYLGSVTIGPGDLSFDTTLAVATQDADVVTATATAIGDTNVSLGTSEFSPLAQISGAKFSDILGDGITADDPPLADYLIRLYRDNGDQQFDAQTDPLIEEVATDADGRYQFQAVLPGRHFVVEVRDERYQQTAGGDNFPEVPYYTVDVTSGADIADRNFANYRIPRLAGRKVLDVDNNGVSETDPPLENWLIQLFRDDGDGVFEPAADTLVSTQLTDAEGRYEFTRFEPGEYFVVEVLQGDYEQTGGGDNFPTVPYYRRSIVGGVAIEGLDFANFDFPNFQGTKYVDLLGDGISPDDDRFPGQRILLYQDDGDGEFNAEIDPLYASTITNLQGDYIFRRVVPGRYFLIDQVPENYVRTAGGDDFPEVPYYTLEVQSGVDVAELDFANARVASIEGRVFADRSGDGRTVDDRPSEGSEVALYRDGDRDGFFDPRRDMLVATEVTNADGEYRFDQLVPGPYLVIDKVTATTRQTAGGQNFPVRPFYVVNLRGGQNVTDRDFAEASFAETGLVTRTIDAADFDGDGDTDLVVVNEFAAPGQATGSVVVLFNDGMGSYPTMRMIQVNGRPHDVTAVNLDGNRDWDLVITLVGSGRSGPLARNRVLTYFSNGDGTFQQGEVFDTVGDGPIDVVAGDFDRDGDVDVAVASFRSDTITVLRNQGRGQMQALTPVRVGKQPIALAALDLDNDGDLDLVSANYGNNTLSLIENQGNLQFVTRASTAATPQPADLEVADFDGDGMLDVAVAGYQFGQVEVHYGLRRSGTTALGNRRTYSVGSATLDAKPHALTALDFDGDGDLDLAVADSESNQIAILEYRGARFFSQGGSFFTDGGTESVVAGDLNGDRGPDLASTTLYRSPLVNQVSGRSYGGVNFSTNRNVNLAVSITNGRSVVVTGERASYTVVVENRGATRVEGAELRSSFPDAFHDVAFTSVASAGASGNTIEAEGPIQETLTLDPGASVTYIVQGTIDPSARGTIELKVLVTASEQFIETDPENNLASDLDDLLPVVNVTLQTDDGGAGEDGNIVVPGETNVTYTATVMNQGPTSATEIEIASVLDLPAGTNVTEITPSHGSFDPTTNRWTVGTLEVDGSATLTLIVAVTELAMIGDQIRHEVRLAQVAEIDRMPEDDADEEITWIGPPPVAPDPGDPGTNPIVTPREGEAVLQGDFDGDGDTELLLHRDGQLREFGTAQATAVWGDWSSDVTWRDFTVGDFDGDGRDDVIARTESGRWWVGLARERRFETSRWGAWSGDVNWLDVTIADYDGDGKDDVAGRTPTGAWWVARSESGAFVNQRWGMWSPEVLWQAVAAMDVNDDGKADLVGRTPAGQRWAAVSDGQSFTNERLLDAPAVDAAFARR